MVPAVLIGLAIFSQAKNASDLTATRKEIKHAQAFFARDDFAAAKAAFIRVARKLEKLEPDSLELLRAYDDAGLSSYLTSEFRESRLWYMKAVKLGEPLPQATGPLSKAYEGLGLMAESRSEATTWYSKAIYLCESQEPGSLDLARAYDDLGAGLETFQELESAKSWLMKALTIKEAKEPGSPDLAKTYYALGLVASDVGDLPAAESWQDKALRIRQAKSPGSLLLADSYSGLGNVAEARGDFGAAEDWFRKALKIRTSSPSAPDLATTYFCLGELEMDRGDDDAAELWFTRALKVRNGMIADPYSAAKLYTNLGIVAKDKGDLEGAKKLFEKAARAFKGLDPHSPDVASAYSNLGGVEADMFVATEGKEGAFKHLAAAKMWDAEALNIREMAVPGSLDLANSYINLGLIAEDRGQLAATEAWFNKAIPIKETMEPGALDLANLYLDIAAAKVGEGKFQEARKFFAKENEIAEEQRSKLLTPEARSLQASLVQAGSAEQVLTFVKLGDLARAAEFLETCKARLVSDSLSNRQIRFDTPSIRALDSRLDAAYGRLAATTSESKAQELRGQIDSLRVQKGEAQKDFLRANPKLASLAYPRPLGLADQRRTIGPDTLELNYIVGEHFSYLLAISDRYVEPFKIEATRKDFELAVSSYVGALRRPGGFSRSPDRSHPASGSRAAGRKLYGWLIKPAETMLKDPATKRLVICPNGPLNALPFAAMPTGNGSYLADRLPITTVPSITTLQQIREERRSATSTPLLALGDPAYRGSRAVSDRGTRAAKRGLSLRRLPKSRDEVQSIAALYGVKALLGRRATTSAFRANASKARIVHLACHGLLDSIEPTASGLALTPEKGTDGLLQAYEVMRDVHLNADLVVLSACETGLGKNEGNEGINGLTRAFEYAGARSVIVSLWDVDDKSTAEFMRLFYTGLKGGESKDAALQHAEMKLRRRYPDPYYWAPFTLCGDWK